MRITPLTATALLALACNRTPESKIASSVLPEDDPLPAEATPAPEPPPDPDAGSGCPRQLAPVATCEVAEGGARCCLEPCMGGLTGGEGVALFAADGTDVATTTRVEDSCLVVEGEGATGVSARPDRWRNDRDEAITLAGGFDAGGLSMTCLGDHDCAAFLAGRDAIAMVLVHDHELLRSEERALQRMLTDAERAGFALEQQHATGERRELIEAWLEEADPKRRAAMPLGEILRGAPAAVVLRYTTPERSIALGWAGGGVVRRGSDGVAEPVAWTTGGTLAIGDMLELARVQP